VVLGAAVGAYALGVNTSSSLPAQLTAAQFGRTLFSPAASNTTQITDSVEISLGSEGWITESQEGRSDTANNEEQLQLTETLDTPGSNPVALESIDTMCFGEHCYVSGNFIGFPITGTTNAHWLAVDVPNYHSIANPLAVIGHAFKGTVHETPLPRLPPSGTAAAYKASGSFTFEQVIAALSSALPSNVSQLASNPHTAALLSGMTMSFRDAIVVVSSEGTLLRFDTPLTVAVSAAAASALDAGSGPASYTGKLLMSRTEAQPLHLVVPTASTVTTPGAVSAAASASS
jgi:hypothetical protein